MPVSRLPLTLTGALLVAVGMLGGCADSNPSTASASQAPTAPAPGVPGLIRETTTADLASTFSDLTKVGEKNVRVFGWNRLEGRGTYLKVPVKVILLGAVEYTNDNGPFDGYVRFVADDGSVLAMYVDGQAINDNNAAGTQLTGRLEFIGATGQFAQQVAAGTFTGTRDSRVGAPVKSVFSLIIDPNGAARGGALPPTAAPATSPPPAPAATGAPSAS